MARRYSSLHHNLGFQDPMTGGKNVKFHREHRSKKNRSKNSAIFREMRRTKKWKQFQNKRKGLDRFDIDLKKFENLDSKSIIKMSYYK